MNLDDLRQYSTEIETRLRLKTFPLAIKLLESETDIPEGTIRPMRNRGHRLLLCQAFAESRRDGTPIAMLKEDNWCVEPVIGYGMAETPQYFLEGHNRFPQDVKTMEAGRNYASDFPRLAPGKYIGVVSAPLAQTNFQPDLVMVYCDTAELSLLLLGREHQDGHHLGCNLSSHAVCVYSVVPVMQTGNYQVAVPCRGDRYTAMAADDEIVFSIPIGKLEGLMAGLRHTATTGSRLPRSYRMAREPEMSTSYQELAKMVGMH